MMFSSLHKQELQHLIMNFDLFFGGHLGIDQKELLLLFLLFLFQWKAQVYIACLETGLILAGLYIYNKFNTFFFFTIVELTGYDWYTIKVILVVISYESNVALITIHNLIYCEKKLCPQNCVPYGNGYANESNKEEWGFGMPMLLICQSNNIRGDASCTSKKLLDERWAVEKGGSWRISKGCSVKYMRQYMDVEAFIFRSNISNYYKMKK